jgi:hypothetical protein
LSGAGSAPSGGPRIAVLADDLIWATRLVDGVRRAGAVPVPTRTDVSFDEALPSVDGAIVDLTARAYDGLAALGRASASAVPAIAVGPHDDVPLRTAAKAAGASRIHPYRALFEHGDRELTAWVASLGAATEGDR